MGAYQAMHPAKTALEALRVYLNDEHGQLRGGVRAALEMLTHRGRLVVVTSGHSEITVLIDSLRAVEVAKDAFPVMKWHKTRMSEGTAKMMEKKDGFVAEPAQRPSAEEMKASSRSRSAVMHLFMKQRGLLCADLGREAGTVLGWPGGNSKDECEGPSEKKPKKRKSAEVGAEDVEEGPKKKKNKAKLEEEGHGEDGEETTDKVVKKKKRTKT